MSLCVASCDYLQSLIDDRQLKDTAAAADSRQLNARLVSFRREGQMQRWRYGVEASFAAPPSALRAAVMRSASGSSRSLLGARRY